MATHDEIFKYEYPATSGRFDVFIGGVNDFEMSNQSSRFSFQACSGFKYSSHAIGGRFGDDDVMGGFVIPVGIEYSPITFTKGVGSSDVLFKYFTRAQHSFQVTNDTLQVSQTITLRTYYPNGHPYVDWIFSNCGSLSYEVKGFDATSPQVMIESFTFKFWGFERKSYPIVY